MTLSMIRSPAFRSMPIGPGVAPSAVIGNGLGLLSRSKGSVPSGPGSSEGAIPSLPSASRPPPRIGQNEALRPNALRRRRDRLARLAGETVIRGEQLLAVDLYGLHPGSLARVEVAEGEDELLAHTLFPWLPLSSRTRVGIRLARRQRKPDLLLEGRAGSEPRQVRHFGKLDLERLRDVKELFRSVQHAALDHHVNAIRIHLPATGRVGVEKTVEEVQVARPGVTRTVTEHQMIRRRGDDRDLQLERARCFHVSSTSAAARRARRG